MIRLSLWLTLVVCLIFSMGLMMVFETTSAEVLDKQGFVVYFSFIKQFIYGAIGLLIAMAILRVGHHVLIEKSPWILAFLSIFLVGVFVPGIGQQINGAHRWIGYKMLSFQPSEFVKIFLPLFAIRQILKKRDALDIKSFYALVLFFIAPVALILLEPDNGTAGLLVVCLVCVFILTKIRFLYWGLPMLILFCMGAVAASQMKHVPDRIRVYLNPELDLLGKGHQPYQAKIAAGSGRLVGRGLGESLQKLNYLPEARSDYIAAIFAEEFGFIGMFFLILSYVLIAFIGFKISMNAQDEKSRVCVASLTFLMCMQAFLNLGVVSGLLPSKGTNLPFFSQGGSSLIANCIILAILISVDKSRIEEYGPHRIRSRRNGRASASRHASL